MIHSQWLKINGVDIINRSMTTGEVLISDPVDTHLSKGNAALLVEVNGDININFQVALGIDKKFYDPIDIDDNDLSLVNANVTSDKWIVYDTMLARAQRFKIIANADSVISIKYIQQEY